MGNSVAAAMIPVPSEFRGLEPSKYVMCLPCFPSPDRDARRFAQRQPGGSAAEAAEVRISFFRSKIAALALLASKIEHRVVVGPDPLIVGSSAAGHHHILDTAHLSRQAAQGLSRLEAKPERGTGVRGFCPPAVDAPRRARLS